MQCQKRTGWLKNQFCTGKAWWRLERLDRSDKVVEDVTYCADHLRAWMFGSKAYWMLSSGDEWSSYRCFLPSCSMPATFRLEVPEYMRPDNTRWSSHYLCKLCVRPFLVELMKGLVEAIDAKRAR